MRTDAPDDAGGRWIDAILRFSIQQRALVVMVALALCGWGAVVATRMPVDVFPDLTAPSVTVVTEAHGMAPEEVEALVTRPLEASLGGQTGVRRVRSSSGVGVSIVWIEFDWSTDVVVARQLVAERLQLAAANLPPDVPPPQLAPVTSVMGEILFVGLRSDRARGHEVRDLAEHVVRRRLLALPGVAQVVPIGGGMRQYQVKVDPERLRYHGLQLADVAHALSTSNQNTSGGLLITGAQQHLVRALGRLESIADVGAVVIADRAGVPVTVGQVADVDVGPASPAIGAGSVDAEPAVVMAVSKQPDVNTLELTARIDAELDRIEDELPDGATLDRHLFRQAEFIDAAIDNVTVALRDGALLVVAIIFAFLVSGRATLISAVSLPVSLLAAVLVLDALGTGLDTMILGGLTIAIGALVDDAIIDVENVVRRLRLEQARPPGERRRAAVVILEASREVRSSIVFATVIVMLVFLPVFFLAGVEGRLLAPLGLAYLVATFASLVVALTVTPAMCMLLLPRMVERPARRSPVLALAQRAYDPALTWALVHTRAVAVGALLLAAGAAALVPTLGRAFLPTFNEGALTVSVVTLPGTSLAASDALGRRAEQLLLRQPEVVSTARRTGRAELDEHAQDVSSSEIEVRLRGSSRSRVAVLAAMRADLARLPGTQVTLGQPLSHRIDHLLSGTRAAIAIKIFGDDLHALRAAAEQIRAVAASVPGAVDVSIEQQIDIPQVVVEFDPDRAARAGTHRGELAEALERALAGEVVTTVLERQRRYDVVVRYADADRQSLDDLRRLLIDVPDHGLLPLGLLADVRWDAGPSSISRESGQRKLVVMANADGGDLGAIVDELRRRIEAEVELPPGVHVVYGGQFEAQARAARTLTWLGVAVVLAIFGLLQLALARIRLALLVMLNLPLALIGGVVAVVLGDGVLSVGSLIGFITLFGVATRNGIMLVSHVEHLRTVEGVPLDVAIAQGARERLSPILMTALCAGLALVPLLLAGDAPGNEIQAPMAAVILGGLASSTALNLFLVPCLYGVLERRRR
ncbi:MAG: efflux RND transporter permease subunit [Kofleriaceae bacterium]